jgi:pyruvate/2-oxoglutarate dehydrogenase complex dihydrolipoamide acyltransferase (E2) component
MAAGTIEIRLPQFPECWETCGNCGQGEVLVLEVHVQAGDVVRHDDNLITLETGKVALDIPSPRAGTVVAVHVAEGDTVSENALIATLAPA